MKFTKRRGIARQKSINEKTVTAMILTMLPYYTHKPTV